MEDTLGLLKALLADMVRVLGADAPDTLRTRSNIAFWTARLGRVEHALELYEALLADRVRVLGADHPETLTTRSNIASLTAELGSVEHALELHEALLADRVRVLGADAPDTLTTLENLVWCLRSLAASPEDAAVDLEARLEELADHGLSDSALGRAIASWIARLRDEGGDSDASPAPA